jgi:ribonucleoside-triphosphate reductase
MSYYAHKTTTSGDLAMTIIKRDGSEVAFDAKKIVKAIKQANKTVAENDRLCDSAIEFIASDILQMCEESPKQPTVEDIQDMVERKIQERGKFGLAKNYIKYRFERELARQNDTVKEKLLATNVQNQNANVDEYSFGGRMGEAISYVAKKYALEHVVSKKSARLHNNNEIYIHDLDAYCVGSHNCLSIPFDKLLANGFTTRQCDIRPAGSINTAMQLVAVIFQLQSLQQFGGVSATHLDWTLVPYIRKSFWKHFKDGLKYIECLSEEEIEAFKKELESNAE